MSLFNPLTDDPDAAVLQGRLDEILLIRRAAIEQLQLSVQMQRSKLPAPAGPPADYWPAFPPYASEQ
jgi:hypothetical protein